LSGDIPYASAFPRIPDRRVSDAVRLFELPAHDRHFRAPNTSDLPFERMGMELAAEMSPNLLTSLHRGGNQRLHPDAARSLRVCQGPPAALFRVDLISGDPITGGGSEFTYSCNGESVETAAGSGGFFNAQCPDGGATALSGDYSVSVSVTA
jgi:hypothetical protein